MTQYSSEHITTRYCSQHITSLRHDILQTSPHDTLLLKSETQSIIANLFIDCLSIVLIWLNMDTLLSKTKRQKNPLIFPSSTAWLLCFFVWLDINTFLSKNKKHHIFDICSTVCLNFFVWYLRLVNYKYILSCGKPKTDWMLKLPRSISPRRERCQAVLLHLIEHIYSLVENQKHKALLLFA